MFIMAHCTCCGHRIGVGDFFCRNCGKKLSSTSKKCRPTTTDERTIIRYYFIQGFKYGVIVIFLRLYHNIVMSERTLKRRLRQYGFKRKDSNITEYALYQVIEDEVAIGPAASLGYRGMWHHLRASFSIRCKRDTVMEMLREIDPEGTENRRARRLVRRNYQSLGPNDCWHIDGYDKLKPYGLPIHGCIDGFSRKVMWLKVVKSNNNPLIPAYFYLKLVQKIGFGPLKLRTDCGTENGIMADSHCFLTNNPGGHLYGSSPANQRIECWWSYCRKSYTTWLIDFFRQMVEDGILIPGHAIHMECSRFVFLKLLQIQLNEVQYAWNTHHIRHSRHGTVAGVPDILYHLSDQLGYSDKKQDITQNRVRRLISQRDILTEALDVIDVIEDHDQDLIDFFKYVVRCGNFSYPHDNWHEGRILFEQIIQCLIN